VSFDNNKSMLDAFNDDGTLKKVIENRLGISYKETFNISGAMIRQGLRNSRAAMPASMFMTTVAKYIYDNFSEENGIVYDYSAGFGQRLVAAMASKNNLKYIGVEPWTKSFKNLNLLYRYIYQHHRCSLHNIGSENFYDENLKEKICLAFSSPPYFDTEIYCNESTQCNLGSYKDYLSYWEKTCENIYKMLKSGGYFILNISEKYKHDLIVICDKYFIHDRDLFLNYNTDKKYKNEPLIVMRKK
jgi:tRNA1(Val) A37 N6-methylase TrmN6